MGIFPALEYRVDDEHEHHVHRQLTLAGERLGQALEEPGLGSRQIPPSDAAFRRGMQQPEYRRHHEGGDEDSEELHDLLAPGRGADEVPRLEVVSQRPSRFRQYSSRPRETPALRENAAGLSPLEASSARASRASFSVH
jgi:hypothetical protein